jgi:hypothetical protein
MSSLSIVRLTLPNGFCCGIFNRVIQDEGSYYVFNMHNIIEKHFGISIAPV